MNSRGKILVALFAFFFAVLSCHAQSVEIPPIYTIPDYLDGNAKAVLQKESDAPTAELLALKEGEQRFNEEYGGKTFVEGDPTATTAINQKALLGEERQKCSEDVLAFNKAVQDAMVSARIARFIGTVGVARGTCVMITIDGRRVPLKDTVPIELNSHIQSGADGHLQILLRDETVFTLEADADMVIDEFVYDPVNSTGKLVVTYIKGIFRYVTGKVARARPENMKVKLAVGVIGPRGTEFETDVEPDGSGSVKLFSGALEITEKRSGRIMLMASGEMITFTSGGIFSLPTRMNGPGSLGEVVVAVTALVLGYLILFFVAERTATRRMPLCNGQNGYYSDNRLIEIVAFYGFWPLRQIDFRVLKRG